MFVNPLKPFSAKVRLPGDKSISHRLVLTSLLLSGNIEITNLSACQDLLTSLEIVQKLGIHIEKRGEDDFLISAPQKKIPTKINTLNCGNSGTTARLLCGILAGQNGKFDLYGDDSLSKRPMKRVLSPLLMMKANIKNTEGTDHLPISIIGSKHLQSIDFSLPVSSAQLKSAIIYAGIQAQGTTKIIEPVKCRDHTEILLENLGFNIQREGSKIHVAGPADITGNWKFEVPGDPSCAAFLAVAAAITPNSKIEFTNCLLNPTRIEFLNVLKEMGAKVSIANRTLTKNTIEPIGSVIVEHESLNSVHLSGSRIPLLIDEIPALAVAMACAIGTSSVRNAKELRFKESDRISALRNGLESFGANFHELEDGFQIIGSSRLTTPSSIGPYSDHRITMALAILGTTGTNRILIKNPEIVKVSWPGFFNALKELN